ncbi:Aste57867_4449 [Aphanomyces stellatus]|uniref:Aste57867_4449 protein n=1 Tax=Aphanomyces stellatus TaxID=120398 RepID=A0A485KCN8_9STRA|nr:hypothetical protein As57867_004437 [Aphanomyces stellatus]VFT81560.1 Aste57867_4449 [Aphanomyces stellatus]
MTVNVSSFAAAIRAQASAPNFEPHCYMCLEPTRGALFSPDELIAPCVCHSHVHRGCLDHWRVTSNTFHAMTQCPTCHTSYTIDTVLVDNEEALHEEIRREQLWRWTLVLGVIFVGSLGLWLMDRGTPAFFHLHWNGLDGKIYEWIGLTQVPRFIVYLVLSFVMTAFITGLVTVLAWCCSAATPGNSVVAIVDGVNCCPTRGGIGYQPMFAPGGDCGCCDGCCGSSGDCGPCGECGHEFGTIVLVVLVVCFVFVGLVVLFSAIVGGIGSAVDRRGERRIRGLVVRQERIRDLRPLRHSLA